MSDPGTVPGSEKEEIRADVGQGQSGQDHAQADVRQPLITPAAPTPQKDKNETTRYKADSTADNGGSQNRPPLRWHDLMGLVFSGAVAFATIMYALYSRDQLAVMRGTLKESQDSSVTTSQLVGANKSLAATAAIALATNKRQTDAALKESKRLNDLTADMVTQAKRQAEANSRLIRAGLAETRKQYRIAERNLALAERVESPAFSVARAGATVEDRDLRINVFIKNSGKSVVKIRQLRWVIASEVVKWATQGATVIPDNTFLGPSDEHVAYQRLEWADAEHLKSDLAVGIRFFILIDYVDFMGKQATAVICQHYDAAGLVLDCQNSAPD